MLILNESSFYIFFGWLVCLFCDAQCVWTDTENWCPMTNQFIKKETTSTKTICWIEITWMSCDYVKSKEEFMTLWAKDRNA